MRTTPQLPTPLHDWKISARLLCSLICTAGEEGAGFAADAHGRLQGLGVAVVTYGVGALKLLNPVAGAYAERSPLW